MIRNLPTPNDFERIAIQSLVQALDLIKNAENELEYLDWIDNEEEAKEETEKYWRYHQGILNNALTLLFLSLENYLKKEICNISPLMLLAERPINWGAIGEDKDFNDIFIHQFDDLLALYQILGLGEVTAHTANKLEGLRKKRNKITHGIIEENITPKYVIQVFHTISFDIWGNGEWWGKLKQYIVDEPLFGIYDSGLEQAFLVKYVHFLKAHLTKNELNELFSLDLSQRNYYCPNCHHSLERDGRADLFESKFAILLPNASDSINLYCLVCDDNFAVDRANCADKDCPGNVLTADEKQCLSCFTHPEDHD